jgi:hypothetical protein
MAFPKGNFTTRKKYAMGHGLIVSLASELPRTYDEKTMGDADAPGYVVKGTVKAVLGALDDAAAPKAGEQIEILVRPGDKRLKIFEDLAQTNERTQFLLEGVVQGETSLEARWAHGAGKNREVTPVEIVGVPHITFENPAKDGPEYLRLNLDGSPTKYDERIENEWVKSEIPFDEVMARLKTAFDKGLKFRVSQRVLTPSKSTSIYGQDELEAMLTTFRQMGSTSCMVRTFLPGTTDPHKVDVQLLTWPEDIAADGENEGKSFDKPTLRDTKRFAALRDGEEMAEMEIIPGYELVLVGNPTDAAKSAKHAFVKNLLKNGLSDSQKNLYRSQTYGPGISIRAKSEDGTVLGLTRPACRTEGTQYRNLASIPSPNFKEADKIDFKTTSNDAE